MSPLANGVVVHLLEYDDFVITDLYKVDDLYVFRSGGRTKRLPIHVLVINIHQWFDENQPTGTMLVKAGDLRFSKAGVAYIKSRSGYELA